jgi:hypothetical protein
MGGCPGLFVVYRCGYIPDRFTAEGAVEGGKGFRGWFTRGPFGTFIDNPPVIVKFKRVPLFFAPAFRKAQVPFLQGFGIF